MLRCAFVLAAAAVLAQSAAAQVARNFPPTALRGELVVGLPPEVSLNGQAARLAPGARIRGQDNMLQMSGALSGARLLVHYTVDPSGLLLDVWILTAAEAAKKPWPTTLKQRTTWVFDPLAQTWTEP
jgi:hypothetical protein